MCKVIDIRPRLNPPSDFGDRMRRIGESLEKINRLMTDLKDLQREYDQAPLAD